jgi:hypothetical protein
MQWHLHDLWPELQLPGSSLFYGNWGTRIARRLARADKTMRVRIARDELRRIRELSQTIKALEAEIASLVAQIAPQLLTEPGLGPLTAAKLVGEIAGAGRFANDASSHAPPDSRRSRSVRATPAATASTAAATARSMRSSNTSRDTRGRVRKPRVTTHRTRGLRTIPPRGGAQAAREASTGGVAAPAEVDFSRRALPPARRREPGLAPASRRREQMEEVDRQRERGAVVAEHAREGNDADVARAASTRTCAAGCGSRARSRRSPPAATAGTPAATARGPAASRCCSGTRAGRTRPVAAPGARAVRARASAAAGCRADHASSSAAPRAASRRLGGP